MVEQTGRPTRPAIPPAGTLLLLLFLASGCGSGPAEQAAPPVTSTATTTHARAATRNPANPKPLLGEAGSAAAGDIPDNQVFITYRGPLFSIKVPEGWPRSGSGRQITFRDKNNIVRVIARRGAPPTVQSVRQELGSLGVRIESEPVAVRIGNVPAIKAVYSTRSAPNEVTGKRVTLVVDRYELGRRGRQAVVDLGTPAGVDNVDAYRLMIASFRLR